MEKIPKVLLIVLLVVSLIALWICSCVRSQTPTETPTERPTYSPADLHFLSVVKDDYWQSGSKHEVLAGFQRLIEDYGQDYPSEEMINSLEVDGCGYGNFLLLLDGFRHGQIPSWKIYYPEANSFPETPLAEEIRNTPYEAFGRLGKILAISHEFPEEWEIAVEEYQKLVEEYSGSQLVNGALFIAGLACPYGSYPEAKEAWTDLTRERVDYLEKNQQNETFLEKWTLLGLYKLIYHRLQGEELVSSKEKIILLGGDNYYLWSAVPSDYPGPHIWDHREITFVVDEEAIPEEAISVILNAFQEWEEATNGGIEFKRVYLPPQEFDQEERGYDILVRVSEQGDYCPTAGCTRRVEHSANKYATIYFNGEVFWEEGISPDLQSTALHEIGHALSLQHSYQEGDIMWRYSGGRPSHLSQRDIDTIRLMYPPE